MSAYKAFKSCVPIEWSSNLYITLVRGLPGTRERHRRTLEALHLGKCNRTVVRKNTPTLRGMLNQVKRLVAIETKEMYEARKQKEANHRALRPPLEEVFEAKNAAPRLKKVITVNPKKLAELIDLVNLPSTHREFMGQSQPSRLGCFMRVWSYIKENNLQDPNNMNIVNCDEKMKRILLGKAKVDLVELTTLVKLHFPKPQK